MFGEFQHFKQQILAFKMHGLCDERKNTFFNFKAYMLKLLIFQVIIGPYLFYLTKIIFSCRHVRPRQGQRATNNTQKLVDL